MREKESVRERKGRKRREGERWCERNQGEKMRVRKRGRREKGSVREKKEEEEG